MFKAAGHYFLLTSGCTGWEPNRAEVFVATCAQASCVYCNSKNRLVVQAYQLAHSLCICGMPTRWWWMLCETSELHSAHSAAIAGCI